MNAGLIVETVNRQHRFVIDEVSLIRAVRSVLGETRIKSGEISIAIVDDLEMHELNREYLNHDYPTDVLSFPLSLNESFLSGEIIASVDTADREAPFHGLTRDEELLLYVIHGALHLAGLDDKDDDSRKQMRDRESYFMKKAGIDFERKVKPIS